MKANQALATLTVAAVIILGSACTTTSAAKVTRQDAEKIALARVPGGKVSEAELEKEHGRLIWSFDIATEGTKDITEVHVDAITGEVIKTEIEKAK